MKNLDKYLSEIQKVKNNKLFVESINTNIKADAVVMSRKGDYKYIFIKGNQPDNLKPDPKGRLKNRIYYKNNKMIYPVIVDMFEHPSIKSDDGDFADIWVVDDLEQAQKQLDLMIKYGARQFYHKIKIK
jgi:hypothetical protein